MLQASPTPPSAATVEAAEEAKLKSKYPSVGLGRPMAGHSAFLQKRLTKGVSTHIGTHYRALENTYYESSELIIMC